MSEPIEYRLSWEMPRSIHWVGQMEAVAGRAVWLAEWRECEWDSPGWRQVEWSRTERITTEPFDQYNNLKKWAETHEQPIRNVKLEKRVVPNADEGWEPT